MNRGHEIKRQSATRSILVELCIVLILLNTLGFPGNYCTILGSWLETLVSYGCFALEIALMLFAKGDSGMDFMLMDLKTKYWPIYLVLAVFFVDSMVVTAYPEEQIITCIRFTVTVLFFLWLNDYCSIIDLLGLIYKASAVYLVLSILFAILKPGIAYSYDEEGFRWLMDAANSASSVYLMCITIQMVLLKEAMRQKNPPGRTFLMVLVGQSLALVLCGSVGAVLCLVIAAVYLFRPASRRGTERRASLGVLYIVISVGFLLTALTILPRLEPVLNLIGKDASLTSRVPLWNRIIKIMQSSHTMGGYGYGMFWRDTSAVHTIHAGFERYSWLASMATGAHNVLLELWLNVGLLGIGTLFLALLVSFQRTEELSEEQYAFCSTYILVFCIHGLIERAFGSHDYQTMFFFLAMAVGCSRQSRPDHLRNTHSECTCEGEPL